MGLLTKDQYQTISKANSYVMDALTIFDNATCITTDSGCYSDVYNVYTQLLDAFTKLSGLTYDSDQISKAYIGGFTHAVMPKDIPDKVEFKDKASIYESPIKEKEYKFIKTHMSSPYGSSVQ
jgi:hypothetical protein